MILIINLERPLHQKGHNYPKSPFLTTQNMNNRSRIALRGLAVMAAVLLVHAGCLANQPPTGHTSGSGALVRLISYYVPEIAFTAAGVSFAYMLLGTFILWRRAKNGGQTTDQG